MKIELDLSEEEAKILLQAQSYSDIGFVQEPLFIAVISKIKEAIRAKNVMVAEPVYSDALNRSRSRHNN